MTATNPGRTNLVSWWTLNELSGTRYDAHGSNNLTDNNTVLYDTGKVGNAASFVNANSEYLSIVDNSTLSFGNESFSLGCWCKLASQTAGRALMSKWLPLGGKREYVLNYVSASDRFEFQIDGTGAYTTHATVTADEYGDVPSAEFVLVIAVHDAANDKIKINVNGGTFDETAYSSGCNDNTSPFCLGTQWDPSGNPSAEMDGLLDEAFVYNKALTSDECTWLYNSGNGRTYNSLPGVKTINGVAVSDIKTINGVAVADIKSIQGLT